MVMVTVGVGSKVGVISGIEVGANVGEIVMGISVGVGSKVEVMGMSVGFGVEVGVFSKKDEL
jgi:hypothetical protein